MNKVAIDAVVYGLLDGGSEYVTGHPGSGSQMFFEGLGGVEISLNERVAFEMAYGGCMAGKRSVVTMKSVGLNVCSDPFFHAVINGINAGLVVVLVDDVDALSSPERQDSRPMREMFGGLWLEPSSVAQAYDLAYQAFAWSEQFDMPVVIRITNQFFELTGDVYRKVRLSGERGVANDRDKYISYWKKRADALTIKQDEVRNFVETLYDDVDSYVHNIGIVWAGNCDRELESVDLIGSDVFRIFTYPLPENKLAKFLSGKSEIRVFEQGGEYVGNKIKEILGSGSGVKINTNSGLPPDKSGEWTKWNDAEKMFKAIKSVGFGFVVGDEGKYTDKTTETIQVCLCMGSSVGIAAGMAINGVDYPLCVTGDVSFLHGGKQSLEEVKARGVKMGIVVIDNGGAASTGGQKPVSSVYNLGNDVPYMEVEYTNCEESQFVELLSRMKAQRNLSVLFVKLL